MTDTETRREKRGRAKPAEPDRRATETSTGDLVAQLGDAAPPKRGRKKGASEESEAQAPSDEVELSDSLPIAAEDDLSEIEGEASARLVSIVESLLFAANKPLGVREIRQLLKDASQRQIQLALKQLGRDLQGRGIVLAQVAGGFRLRTDPENSRWVQLLLAERPARLSRSQLETLAVIAYRQPVTKPEVDHIRGVDCGAVMKILLDHDLVRIVGRKEEPGRPHLYGTTLKFLEFFNLRSLRDMPDLHEFRELTEESRQLVAEQLGEGALFDERESMGQEVLHWDGANEGADDDASAQGHDDAETAEADEQDSEQPADATDVEGDDGPAEADVEGDDEADDEADVE
ncbi:MAG TPA: SMC-Scp complex subunit ScpB [Nannocystaceae bacterium]|nr:SMC-Scp complex subunit ScpB [Nannocystaceae bacterium]